MSGSSRFPTHHIPDDGTPYTPGEIVRIDQSSGRITLIKDVAVTTKSLTCRPATEYPGNPPWLRVGLRKRVAAPVEDPNPWSSTRPASW